MARYIVSFLILNYKTADMTKQTVDLLRKHQPRESYCVVIVDNGSEDGSYETLKREYKDQDDIFVLACAKNEGFARGNNVGYDFIKQRDMSEYIVCMNSDVFIEQPDFIECIQKIHEETGFYMLGPDIINKQSKHCNPHREKLFSMKDVNRRIVNQWIFKKYFQVKKLLHIQDKLYILEDWMDALANKERSRIAWDKPMTDVVLHGSCLIFSREYINVFSQAFCPDTFLYFEEDIRCFECVNMGYRVQYDPRIQVRHLEGISSAIDKDKRYQKKEAYVKHIYDSARVLKKTMKGR